MKKPIERSRLLRSLFFPHPAVVAVCVPAAAALVSMLSLEVAMLAAFSTEEQAAFSAGMIAGSGFGVCAMVAGLGTVMWVQANRALRRSPATTPRR